MKSIYWKSMWMILILLPILSGCSEKNEKNIRDHFQREIGPVLWKDLEIFFARGMIIEVDQNLDLLDTAVAAALNDTEKIQGLMQAGLIHKLQDETALELSQSNGVLLGVVSPPWVFVQRM